MFSIIAATLATPSAAMAVTVPAAPSNVIVTAITGDSVTLRWTDRATNETDFSVHYCYYGPTAPPPGSVIICGFDEPFGTARDTRDGQPAATGWTVTKSFYDIGNTQDGYYAFHVHARNSAGESASPNGYLYLYPSRPYVTVPSVRFDAVQVAITRITNADLEPRFLNSGDWVFTQSPASGTRIPTGSEVRMTLRTGEIP